MSKSLVTKISAFTTSLVALALSIPASVKAQAAQGANGGLSPTNDLTLENLKKMDPLLKYSDPATAAQLSTPGGIITRFLVYAFPIAGLILFVMIVWGGFEILSGATDKKSMDQGKNRVTSALVGFILLFASYWVAQIVQVIFGLKIL